MAPRKNKKEVEVSEPAVGLTLEIADTGTPVTPVAYPETVVGTLRHMLSRLVRERHLPPSVSMLAALSGEGVTYVSLALACTLAADTERSYCVIELNWWRPGMVKQLIEIKPEGLGAIFTSGAALDDVLVQTKRPNLALLPAGLLPLELRAVTSRGAQLKEIIATLGKRFDHLILDVPAISLTSDAIPLAFLADTGCLVIRQGVTPAAVVKRALIDIDHLVMLGAVLNQAKTAMPASMGKMLLSE